MPNRGWFISGSFSFSASLGPARKVDVLSGAIQLPQLPPTWHLTGSPYKESYLPGTLPQMLSWWEGSRPWVGGSVGGRVGPGLAFPGGSAHRHSAGPTGRVRQHPLGDAGGTVELSERRTGVSPI